MSKTFNHDAIRPRWQAWRESLRASPVHQDAFRYQDASQCAACRARHARCTGCGYAIGGCELEDEVLRCAIVEERPLKPVRLLITGSREAR